MESNSKLGPEVIPNDPHNISVNGEILHDIICQYGLIVVNGLSEVCNVM